MEPDTKKLEEFKKSKHVALNKKDLSRKGSIDEPIRPLVTLINQSPHFYTTSTCSGRITLTEKPIGKSGIKKGNNFLLNSHDFVDLNEIRTIIDQFNKSNDDSQEDKCLWLKFEPFIMHVQCFDMEKARLLLNIALAAGCRNSGITLGKPDKFMVAVRSTSSMESPVCSTRGLTQSEGHIQFLCEESNRRLSANMERLARLSQAVEANLGSGDVGQTSNSY